MSLVTGTLERDLEPGSERFEVSEIQRSYIFVEACESKSKSQKRCRGFYKQISNAKVANVASSKTQRMNTLALKIHIFAFHA